MRNYSPILGFLFLFVVPSVNAEWILSYSIGTAFNAPTDITVLQSNHPNKDIDSITFDTKGFESPHYYAIKIKRSTWPFEIEHIHQKIYMSDRDAVSNGFSKFEVTDGYNLFFFNRVNSVDLNTVEMNVRYGIGVVIAHPDISFDDDGDGVGDRSNFKRGGGAIPKIWQDGYHIGGLAGQVALEFKGNTSVKNLGWSVESKLTVAGTEIPVDDGTVEIDNTALHLLLGLAYKF